jgi:hypothetical protein
MGGWLGGLATGLLIAIGTQLLSHLLQRRRTLRDRLFDKYSELVGVAANEIHRARSAAALFAVGQGPLKDEESRVIWVRLEEQRHAFQRDLSRLCLQIQILEHDPSLVQKVKKLRAIQPFLLAGEWQRGNFNERFDKFENSIREFDAAVQTLTDEILGRRARFSLAGERWPVRWWFREPSRGTAP